MFIVQILALLTNPSLLLQPNETLEQLFERKIIIVQDLYTLINPAFSAVFFIYLKIFSQVYEAFVRRAVNCQRRD